MQCTRFGDMPRATAEPPIVYSRINAQPIIQATLQAIIMLKSQMNSSNAMAHGINKEIIEQIQSDSVPNLKKEIFSYELKD